MDNWREGIDLNEERSTVDNFPEARDDFQSEHYESLMGGPDDVYFEFLDDCFEMFENEQEEGYIEDDEDQYIEDDVEDIVKEILKLKALKSEIENQINTLSDNIVEILTSGELNDVQTCGYVLKIINKKKYSYSNAVQSMENLIKKIKKNERNKGIACIAESKKILYFYKLKNSEDI